MSGQTYDKEKNAIVSCSQVNVSKRYRIPCPRSKNKVYHTPGFKKCNGCVYARYEKMNNA
jgi:hypothetical protein